MNVLVIRAWPRHFEQEALTLPEGACVADAVRLSTLAGVSIDDLPVPACAIFGINADANTLLHEGDRIELLRPLQLDPKDARRRRAVKAGK